MINISTWNSIGHPDRMADYICAYLVDRIIAQNPEAQCDLKVSVQKNNVFVYGKLSTFNAVDVVPWVRQAVNEIGYTEGYWHDFCGLTNKSDFTVNRDFISLFLEDFDVSLKSFAWGMATNTPETDYLPWDFFIAKKITNLLSANRSCGIDVSVNAVDSDRKSINACVTFAFGTEENEVVEYIKTIIPKGCDFTFTPRFSPFHQGVNRRCGLSGQDQQNLYGSTLPVSYNGWGKYGIDNELLFLLIARFAALEFIKKNPEFSEIRSYVALSDDAEEINVILFDEKMQQISHYCKPADLPRLVSLFGLNKSHFCEMCKLGVFASI